MYATQAELASFGAELRDNIFVQMHRDQGRVASTELTLFEKIAAANAV